MDSITITGMAHRRRSLFAVLLPAIALLCEPARSADAARVLTFEDRVAAQTAIERVYYSHQIGTTRPFEEAVPRAVIESKVRVYLDQSLEMERSLGMPLTSEALAAEAVRMARDTRMPERLAELHAALGNDSLLIQEALARPSLLKRRAQESEVTDPDALTAGSCSPGDVWTSTLLSQPGPAGDAPVVWTGSLLFTYRGEPGGNTGAVYDPVLDTWTAISLLGSPTCTTTPIWTGHEVIVWCPGDGSPQYGGRYDPVSDTWRGMAGLRDFRGGHSVVWAGDRMIVWGGVCTDPDDFICTDYDRPHELNSGYAYLPDTDTWSSLSPFYFSSVYSDGRAYHKAVWTGSRMMVWGGSIAYEPEVPGPNPVLTGTLGDGVLYDPVTDTWQPVSNVSAPASREGHTILWTGTKVLIWGGETIVETIIDSDGTVEGYYQLHDSGGRYDPATNTWAPLTSTGAPTARRGAGAVWTGREAIFWGGGSDDPGAIYVPSSGRWYPMSQVNAPADKRGSSVAWDGEAMLIYGGGVAGRGGRYVPGDVAGIADADQDGFSTCTGDCDDTAAAVHPGVAEVCDAIDNNCDGRVDEGGQPDADGDGYAAGCGDCNDGNPSVYAAAPQVCGDSLNNDCLHPSWPSLAGTNEVDDDADGFSECQGDCADGDPSSHPGALDLCDGVDNNCDGQLEETTDVDGDGQSACGGDCQPINQTVYSGAPQVCGDGLNNDCGSPGWPSLAGTNESDNDGDGFSECQQDCSDANAGVWMAPSEPTNLVLTHNVTTGNTSLAWSASAQPGAAIVFYDVLRTRTKNNFVSPTTCLETNESNNTSAVDTVVPVAGTGSFFLVRAENDCPASSRAGSRSNGAPITARSCP